MDRRRPGTGDRARTDRAPARHGMDRPALNPGAPWPVRAVGRGDRIGCAHVGAVQPSGRAHRRRYPRRRSGAGHQRRRPPLRRPAARPLRRRAWRPASRCCGTPRTHWPGSTPTRWTPADGSTTHSSRRWSSGACSTLTEVREHEWNPLAHNPGRAALRAARPALRPGRAAAGGLAGRLAAIPDALATARATLVDCPRIHLETAVGQFRGTAALVRDRGARPAGRGARACGPRWSRSPPTRWPRRWRSSPAGCGGRAAGPARARPAAGPAAVGGAAVAHPRHRADRGRGAAPGPDRTWSGSPSEIRGGRGRAGRRAGRRRHRPGRAEPPGRRAPGRRDHRGAGPGDAGRDDRVRPATTIWCPLWTTRA